MIKPRVVAPDIADPSEAEDASGRHTHRSPNFPFVSLEKAFERVKQLHDAEGRHAVRVDVAAKHWGYTGKSSGLLQTVGALRMFGLIQVDGGTGMARTIRLTDRALRLILDKRPDEQSKAVREAALAPPLYSDLWKKWGSKPPSPENAESYLIIDLHFNPGTAPAVLASYKKTVEFAKLDESANLSSGGTDSRPTDEGQEEDMVEPQRHQEGRSPVEPGASQQQQKSAQQSLFRGEEEHFRLKLAGGRTVRVLFQGEPPTQAEIDKLIKLLELQKDQYPES